MFKMKVEDDHEGGECWEVAAGGEEVSAWRCGRKEAPAGGRGR